MVIIKPPREKINSYIKNNNNTKNSTISILTKSFIIYNNTKGYKDT